MRLRSTGTSPICSPSEFSGLEVKSNWRDGDGVGGGLGWVRVKGNSTARSLVKRWQGIWHGLASIDELPSHCNDDLHFDFVLHDDTEILLLYGITNASMIAGRKRREQWAQRWRKTRETYMVEEAKFVSSCFNFPSNAKPRLSLLLAKRGVSA